MHKLRNITNPMDLSEADIEFLTGKNSIPDSHIFNKGNSNSSRDALEQQYIPFSQTKCGKVLPQKTNVTKIDQNMCTNCHSKDSIVSDHFGGMVVCQNCGQVLESSVLDHGPEWNNYDDGPCSSRCGLPTNTLLPQSSLGTTISGNCNYRLKTLHNWGLMPYRERSLNTVLNMIKAKCDNAGLLGCIVDDAKILYKIASDCKNLTQKNNNIIIDD